MSQYEQLYKNLKSKRYERLNESSDKEAISELAHWFYRFCLDEFEKADPDLDQKALGKLEHTDPELFPDVGRYGDKGVTFKLNDSIVYKDTLENDTEVIEDNVQGSKAVATAIKEFVKNLSKNEERVDEDFMNPIPKEFKDTLNKSIDKLKDISDGISKSIGYLNRVKRDLTGRESINDIEEKKAKIISNLSDYTKLDFDSLFGEDN